MDASVIIIRKDEQIVRLPVPSFAEVAAIFKEGFWEAIEGGMPAL